MNRRRRWIVLAALLPVAGGAAAGGDRLVTRDGQIIETRGPWQERGKLLVFELADGTLASLRIEEADLEASEGLARETERRAQGVREASLRPAPEPRRAAVVLTDSDVAHFGVGEQREPEGGSGDDLAAAAAASADVDADAATAGRPVASSGRGVQVVQWSQESEGEDGVAVRGVIQNLGSSFATSLSVNVLFYDESGSLVAAREVQFEDAPLGPGARGDFSVSVPHALVFDEIKFQVVGRGFRSVAQRVRAVAPRESPPDAPDVP